MDTKDTKDTKDPKIREANFPVEFAPFVHFAPFVDFVSV